MVSASTVGITTLRMGSSGTPGTLGTLGSVTGEPLGGAGVGAPLTGGVDTGGAGAELVVGGAAGVAAAGSCVLVLMPLAWVFVLAGVFVPLAGVFGVLVVGFLDRGVLGDVRKVLWRRRRW